MERVSSAYITPEGFARLRAEYQDLWNQRRPEVVRALSAAAAEGDRSENAEYIYRKKELREIDRRVHYLQQRLPELKVVSAAPGNTGRVFFGAWVELRDSAGRTKVLRIVGPDEIDTQRYYVSIDSPLARELLGKNEGEAFDAMLPGGEAEYEIVRIAYGESIPWAPAP